MSNFEPSIVLASASVRRKELLAEAGYNFTVFPSDIDEGVYSAEGVGSCEYAKQLALAKSKDVAVKFPDSFVLGADTVANLDRQIIGKPIDAKEAEQIVRGLFSRPHKVVTGLAIVRVSDGIELSESDSTTIYPKKISEDQIAEHIKSGCWQDKAGAYAIDQAGDELIEKIEGSLTNVMGLPMELLEKMLQKLPG